MNKIDIEKKAYERYLWRRQNNTQGTPEGDWKWAETMLEAVEFTAMFEEKYFKYPKET